jgi:hypothetical protein
LIDSRSIKIEVAPGYQVIQKVAYGFSSPGGDIVFDMESEIAQVVSNGNPIGHQPEKILRLGYLSELSKLRQLRRIPSTADGFYEEDAGIHATPLNIDAIALICHQHRLRRDDLEIVVYATLIPFVEESKRFFGRCRQRWSATFVVLPATLDISTQDRLLDFCSRATDVELPS